MTYVDSRQRLARATAAGSRHKSGIQLHTDEATGVHSLELGCERNSPAVTMMPR
jgi:hypothetical protein